MSDSDLSLREKLMRLAGKDDLLPGGVRRLAVQGSGTGFEAILAEVDDTILLTKLSLSCGAGQVDLAVAGRRVLAVTSASDTLGFDAQLLGVPLDPEDPGVVEGVASLLAALTAPNEDVTLVTGPAERPGSESDPGLSPTALVPPDPLPDVAIDPALLAFAQACQAHGSALISNGEVVLASGPDDLVDLLLAALDGQLADFDELRFEVAGDHQDPSLTFLNGVLPEGLGLAFAIVGQDFGIFAFDVAQLGALHRLWRLKTEGLEAS